jgi:hypothetical protein
MFVRHKMKTEVFASGISLRYSYSLTSTMESSSSMPGSIWLAPSSAPGPSQNTITTVPDAMKSSQVKPPHARTESAPQTGFSTSPALLQVPTSRETFDKLYEVRAPPPLTVSSDRIVLPTKACREGSKSDNSLKFTSPSKIPLPPSPPSEYAADLDSDGPAIIQRPPSSSQTETRPKLEVPEPKGPKQIARRYLQPAYIRGESLPFAIKEVHEPDTSESQYSVESALDLNGAPAGPQSSVTSRSASQPLQLEEKAGPSGDSVAENGPAKSPQASGSAKSDDGEAAHPPATGPKKGRTLLKKISPKKNIKDLLDRGRRFGIRARLRSLRE